MRGLGKRSKNVIKTTAFTITIAFTFFVTLFTLQLHMGFIGNMMLGCEGIDYFYTGEDFYQDYSNLMMEMDYNMGEHPKPPSAIVNGEYVDCDTMSNAIFCLSQLYNDTECRFYTYYVADQTVERFEDLYGHLGIKCRKTSIFENGTENIGNWMTLF